MQPTIKGRKKGMKVNLARMMERRDQGIKDSLVSRDQAWLNSFHSCSESMRLMTQE